MRKRMMFVVIACIVVSFMGWDIYENNEKEKVALARDKKIYTISEILGENEFNAQESHVRIIENSSKDGGRIEKEEEQREQIIEELSNLMLKESKEIPQLDNKKLISITLNKDHLLYVLEKEQHIQVVDYKEGIPQHFAIINGEDFFKSINETK